MLFNRLNLEVARFASDSGVRPEIGGVFFKPDRTVATDSFRLCEITTPSNVKVEEFPQVQGKSAMRGFAPFIVQAKGLKDIKLPAKASLPILENVAVKHLDDKAVEFLTTDLEVANTTSVRRIEGKFPDYEQIFPKGEPVAEVVVNAKYLKELLDTLGKLDQRGNVKMKIYGKELPVLLEAKNDNQSGRGLLMPIRAE